MEPKSVTIQGKLEIRASNPANKLTRFPFLCWDRFIFHCFFGFIFSLFFGSGFCSLFGRFWNHFGSHFRSIFVTFFDQKSSRFFDRFFIDFWMDFGSLNPWKWAPRVRETLIFTKSPFSILARFSNKKWFKKTPKMEATLLQKSIKKSMRFLSWKMLVLGAKMGPTWTKNEDKMSSTKYQKGS